jgi:Spy/CpxP family protein refolding chaperone
MTAVAVVQIVGWAAQAVQIIADLIKTAVAGAEPKTLDQLDAELIAIISGRQADRAKAAAEAKAAADQALADAAVGEFGEEPRKP